MFLRSSGAGLPRLSQIKGRQMVALLFTWNTVIELNWTDGLFQTCGQKAEQY